MRSMAAALSILLFTMLPFIVIASTPLPLLTTQQKRMLVKADFIGGPRLAAIIYQESSACAEVHSAVDPLACGCGGTHAGTASLIVGSEVACEFLNIDWDFSIRVAALYLEKCTEIFGYRPAITCYQQGIPKARTMKQRQLLDSDYLKAIDKRMAELRRIPLSTD